MFISRTLDSLIHLLFVKVSLLLKEHIYVFYLRNRFLLTVIGCPIYHWLEVSREVDISQARSASDISIDE